MHWIRTDRIIKREEKGQRKKERENSQQSVMIPNTFLQYYCYSKQLNSS